MKMVKVKTAELTGNALDWTVAKAVGLHLSQDLGGNWYGAYIAQKGSAPVFSSMNFSSDWGAGGPLIDYHKVNLKHLELPSLGSAWQAEIKGNSKILYGKEALEAACKAVVFKSFGDEVEVPQVLL